MKSGFTAVNKVYSILTQAGGVSCPVYKYEKPTAISQTEYIVINALPVTAGVLQTLRVNVNFHVKNLTIGVPNISRLEVMTTFIQDFLEQVNDNVNGIYIDFENQQFFSIPEPIGEHYSNIRLVVKLLNK